MTATATEATAPAEATTPTAPAEATAPPAIADLPAKFEDDSTITSKAEAEKIFLQFTDLAEAWIGGYRSMRKATETVCELSYNLRNLCLRKDGKKDWAGQTKAYAALYEERVTYVLAHVLKLTKTERTAFGAAVRRWDSDNEYRKLYIARKLAEADKAIGVKPADIVPGFKPPAKLVSALVAEAQGQTKTNKDGTTSFLPGFTEPQKFAEQEVGIGLKKSERKPPAAPVATEQTPSQVMGQRARRHRRPQRRRAAFPSSRRRTNLHRAAATLAENDHGDIPQGIASKADLIAEVTATRDLLTSLIRRPERQGAPS